MAKGGKPAGGRGKKRTKMQNIPGKTVPDLLDRGY